MWWCSQQQHAKINQPRGPWPLKHFPSRLLEEPPALNDAQHGVLRVHPGSLHPVIHVCKFSKWFRWRFRGLRPSHSLVPSGRTMGRPPRIEETTLQFQNEMISTFNYHSRENKRNVWVSLWRCAGWGRRCFLQFFFTASPFGDRFFSRLRQAGFKWSASEKERRPRLTSSPVLLLRVSIGDHTWSNVKNKMHALDVWEMAGCHCVFTWPFDRQKT